MSAEKPQCPYKMISQPTEEKNSHKRDNYWQFNENQCNREIKRENYREI